MLLFEIFKETALSPVDVIQEAMRKKLVPPHDTPEYIRENFSMLVEELQADAYMIYLETEKAAGQTAIRSVLNERTSADASREEVINETCNIFKELDRLFLSISQSRKTRAGSAFEIILRTLFKKIDYPFDEQQVINGKPDFLMPGRRHYDTNSMDCIIFTVKRTLRERWRQIVTEGTRGLGFYLATIDEKVSSNQLDEMRDHRIYLVIPVDIKNRIERYSTAHNVITYEEFFKYHLDPAVTRWHDQGII
ncbi:MAG TPA: hypothetical protein ENG95_00935 [Nitrospirae bacterium]|nr:hypothetical protein [Nitrospirota bacterium]